MVNLTTEARVFKRASTDTSGVPMVAGAIGSHYAEAWTFKAAAAGRVMRVTTCSGSVHLTVTITS